MRCLKSAAVRAVTVLVAFLGSPIATAAAAEIVKIEEIWEVVVTQPDAATHSPQLTFLTHPGIDLDQTYFQVQLNYAADTEFSPGGFHVAAVDQETFVDEARSETRSVLAVPNDRIRWTNVMAVIDDRLLFAVKDGYGEQWGHFGGPEYLVRITPSPVADLSKYHPQQSLDAVDISFGANRVQSVTLIEVKCFYDDGHSVTVPVNRQPD